LNFFILQIKKNEVKIFLCECNSGHTSFSWINDRKVKHLVEKTERIDNLVNEIISRAGDKAKTFTQKAKEQEAEILAKAKERAEKKKQELIERQSKNIHEKTEQELAAINLETRRAILYQKEEYIQEIFKKARQKLVSFTKKKDYQAVLRDFIVQGAKAIGGGKLIIQARKEDQKLLKDLSKFEKAIKKEINSSFSLAVEDKPIKAMGGIIIKTHDGAITIDNTFDARLEEKYQKIRFEVAKILFNQ
jgi:vacuolar-type H+-ATPase subunit E/Vma4